jgi:hypothetical protein
VPILLKGRKQGAPAVPVAAPDAEMSLEDLGRAVCPKCRKPIDWEVDAAEVGREAGAVHAACGLVFVAHNMTWKVTVMDKYKNALALGKDGKLCFPRLVDPTPRVKTPRYHVNKNFQGQTGEGFLMVDEPAAPPVRERSRASDPEDPEVEEEQEDERETVEGEPGEIAEPDFPTEG